MLRRLFLPQKLDSRQNDYENSLSLATWSTEVIEAHKKKICLGFDTYWTQLKKHLDGRACLLLNERKAPVALAHTHTSFNLVRHCAWCLLKNAHVKIYTLNQVFFSSIHCLIMTPYWCEFLNTIQRMSGA